MSGDTIDLLIEAEPDADVEDGRRRARVAPLVTCIEIRAGQLTEDDVEQLLPALEQMLRFAAERRHLVERLESAEAIARNFEKLHHDATTQIAELRAAAGRPVDVGAEEAELRGLRKENVALKERLREQDQALKEAADIMIGIDQHLHDLDEQLVKAGKLPAAPVTPEERLEALRACDPHATDL